MKKIISILLAVLMLCALCVTASAEESDYLCLTSTGSTTIGFDIFPSSGDYKLEYSVMGRDWVRATAATSISLGDGESVRFRANGNENTINSWDYLQFMIGGTGTVAASGSVMSLLDGSECCEYCFCSLFKGCTALTTAPQLPATTLADRCYYYMFDGCTSLTTAPQLPATTLADRCYYDMFNGCTSLTITAEKPTVGAYSEIFIPDADKCNNMFYGVPNAPRPESGKTYYCCYECTHDWDAATGKCAVCGYECTHDWDAATGKCSVCGAKKCALGLASHIWDAATGKCTVCEFACPHEKGFATGKCEDCGKACPHTELDNGFCTVCDYFDPSQHTHDFTSGTCKCGEACPHENTTTSCNDCNMEIATPATASGDTASTLSEGNMTVVCTIAGIAVGFLAAMLIFKKKKPEDRVES